MVVLARMRAWRGGEEEGVAVGRRSRRQPGRGGWCDSVGGGEEEKENEEEGVAALVVARTRRRA